MWLNNLPKDLKSAIVASLFMLLSTNLYYLLIMPFSHLCPYAYMWIFPGIFRAIALHSSRGAICLKLKGWDLKSTAPLHCVFLGGMSCPFFLALVYFLGCNRCLVYV